MALEKDITRREFLKWFSLGVASISLTSCDVAVDKISREASKLASADDDEYFYIADIKTESLVNPNSLSAGNAFISTPQGRIKITGQGGENY